MSDNEFEKWLSNVYSCNQASIRNLSTSPTVQQQKEEDDYDLVNQLAVLSKLDLGDPTHKSFEYPSNTETSESKKRSAYAVHQEQKQFNNKKPWFLIKTFKSFFYFFEKRNFNFSSFCSNY